VKSGEYSRQSSAVFPRHNSARYDCLPEVSILVARAKMTQVTLFEKTKATSVFETRQIILAYVAIVSNCFQICV